MSAASPDAALIVEVDENAMKEERGNVLVQRARDRLQELDAHVVIEMALNYLKRRPDDGFDWYQRLPFVSFLMIKWAAELWGPEAQRRAPTPQDFDDIHQMIWDAIGTLVSPLPKSIGMRRIAFQQFWFQRGFDVGSIPRQAAIFGHLMRDGSVMREFVSEVGIEPGDFVRQLAAMASQTGDLFELPLLSALKPEPRTADATHWSILRQFLVCELPALHERMRALASYGTPRDVELCEQSPLIRTPFIATSRGDECVHHKVLFRALETALYDILRARGPEVFMRDFGPAFEAYVGDVIAETGCFVVPEDQLQAILDGDGKCVDYALVTDDLLLLVDSKGIEGHYDELYHSLPEVLTAKLRTTALHAADQAVDTVRRLPSYLRRPMTAFLCVTYKQLNIGDGNALRDLTIGTSEWDAPRWHEASLPPAQMFTISIWELELLCGVARAGTPLVEVLRKILIDNAAPETRKLLFEQHMAPYGSVSIPQCSRDAAAALCGMFGE